MMSRIDTPSRTSRAFVVKPIARVAVLLLLATSGIRTIAAQTKASSTPKPCTFSDAQFDPATDVRALENYKNAVAQLLKNQDFTTLDCVGEAARTGKTRFSGGAWKLHIFYQGLESPRPGHPTEEDWHQHMLLVQQWRDKDPQSITARIALAKSDISYGWEARGDQYANTVSESGWKLFAQRLAEAKNVLGEAAAMPVKDPESFYAMQQISLGQSWDDSESTALLQKAIAFEPGYYYYYQARARYLQPKWNGEQGDPARFAKSFADKIGGDDGDILYFQTDVGISCGCEDPDMNDFSWARLQKGFTALETKYGPSLITANFAALMAAKAQQWEAAEPLFERIADRWDEDVWITEQWFNQNRDWATQLAPMQAKMRLFRNDAEANLKTSEGEAYRQEIERKLMPFEQACVNPENSASAKFQLFIEVGKDGSATNAHTEAQANPMAWCIMKGLYESYVRKETPFPAPSKSPYALMVEVDPSTLKASSK